MIDLQNSRDKIDGIDRKIVELFGERMQIAKDVAEYKLHTGKKVYDRERELHKLNQVKKMASSEFNEHGVEELFAQIMSISRKLQYSLLADSHKEERFKPYESLTYDSNTKVAFFGEPGSYTEQAMYEYFQNEVKGIPTDTFKGVMDLVQQDKVDYGILPIENSSTGGITDIFDLFMDYDNTIIGEHIVKVDHVLMAPCGATLEGLKEVYSHEQGIWQCKSYFEDKPWITLNKAESTSAAAKKVAADGKLTQAAIGSARAAKVYGLQILDRGINREALNRTRFIIITKEPIFRKDANKVSLCFELPHESGSLYNMLSHIMYNNLNMTKIESRPISGRTWEYRFFVDFEGNLMEPGVRNAIRGIKEEASNLRILGNYDSDER